MKIIINKKALLESLNKLAAFMKKEDQVIISAKKANLYLFGRSIFSKISSEVKISVKDEAAGLKIDEPFSMKLDFLTLLKAVRQFSDEVIELRPISNEVIRLALTSKEFEISVSARYTEYNSGFTPGKQIGKFQSGRLDELFKSIAYSVSERLDRPLFNHVHFQLKDDELLVEATDSHRMARYTDKTIIKNNFDLLIPQIVAKNISKYFGKAAWIKFEQRDEFIILKTTNAIIGWKALEEVYPDTNRLVPERKDMIAYKFDLKSLEAALKRMLNLSDGSNYNSIVRLDFVRDRAQLNDGSLGFSLFGYHQELKLLDECPALTIGFNPLYIIDAIKHLPKESKTVRLLITSNTRPLIVESELASNFLQLVTPIRMG